MWPIRYFEIATLRNLQISIAFQINEREFLDKSNEMIHLDNTFNVIKCYSRLPLILNQQLKETFPLLKSVYFYIWLFGVAATISANPTFSHFSRYYSIIKQTDLKFIDVKKRTKKINFFIKDCYLKSEKTLQLGLF